MKYKEKFGTIMAISNEKISYLLNKSKRAISVSFMLSNCIELSFDNAYKMIYQGSNEYKMFPYYHILTHLGYNFNFYFVIESTEEYGCFHVDSKKIILMKLKINRAKNFQIISDFLINLPDISQFDNEILSDINSHYFFSMLLQPFSWKISVSVIHLTKSLMVISARKKL